MRFVPIAILAAGSMIASFFMSWSIGPFGGTIGPWAAINTWEDEIYRTLAESYSSELYVFAASFAVAGVFLVLCLLGRSSKLLAFITGALPIGLVGWLLFSFAAEASRINLPSPTSDEFRVMISNSSEFIGPGVWAWICGAACLLLLGIFDPGRKKT
jgi:glucan phosphoethanolaminetransferase (alkaline phosphatase superfamily)